MRVYKENINHFNAFYRSDYYSYLKENDYDCVDKIFQVYMKILMIVTLLFIRS